MINIEKIEEFVDNYLKDSKVYLVEVVVSGESVMVALDSREGVDLNLCAHLSRELYAELSPEIEDYELEVGSAGLTSPFKVRRQWENAIGERVATVLFSGVKEEGVLSSLTEDGCVLVVERMEKPEGAKRKKKVEKEIEMKFSDIKSCVRVIEVKRNKK